MADQKISALTAYSAPLGTDVLPIVDVTTTATKKITLDDLMGGDWETVSFSADLFTAAGAMTWTVQAADVVTHKYWLFRERTMFLSINVENTTVGGTPGTILYVTIPGGYTAASQNWAASRVVDNGTVDMGMAYSVAGDTKIYLVKRDNSNFTASTNGTNVRFTIWFDLVQVV